MNRFAESPETAAYSQPLMMLRTQFSETAKEILAENSSDSRLGPPSIEHMLNETWKMVTASQIGGGRNETIVVGAEGDTLFPRHIDDMLHMLNQHRPITRTASPHEKPIVGHDTDDPSGLGDGSDLSIIEISPVRADPVDPGVGHDEGLMGIMNVHRIPETLRTNMSQIDENALGIELLHEFSTLDSQTLVATQEVYGRR